MKETIHEGYEEERVATEFAENTEKSDFSVSSVDTLSSSSCSFVLLSVVFLFFVNVFGRGLVGCW
ncbi:MAG: hypothetical protein BECKG1743D_GA0114223_105662 [Candidatus Kentron sp. G]|nr:MAG: hypothetical protein BECKG1743F_GA0114225_105833 [Candidatus Kentron sp. G]VFN02697.1 MAG: hypothetical protein BECKG1743E_GA0114224_105332 [Candidatus Kentron sp. G]VFN04264.1 MAG: hypothetical protein BECKG1743D_GA0114223_105662 [Candidatus Kentron sp. G]